MSQLKDLQMIRAGNLVTIQWAGSPKFSIGVLSTQSEPDAFDRAANAVADESSRPGFALDELRACAAAIRKHAAALRRSEASATPAVLP